MSKFRWRPSLAVTLAYLGGIGILGLWIVLDFPLWTQIPIVIVPLFLLFALAED